jgi:hypothetical protein
MKPKAALLIPACMLLLAGAVLAGAPGPAGAQSVPAFVDEQAVLIARLDLGRVDPKQVEQWLDGLGFPAGLTSKVAAASQVLSGLRSAGAHELYVVMSPACLPGLPLVVAVPLTEKADPAAIGRAFGAGRGTTAEMYGAVCAAPQATLDRLRKVAGAVPALLAQGFAQTDGAPLRVAVSLTADQRRAIEETLPVLPEELGGGSTLPLTRGLLWAAVQAAPPPHASLRVTLQCQDQEAAEKLHASLARLLAALGRLDQVKQVMPNYDQVVATLMPKVAGNSLVLSLGESEIDRNVKEWLSPALEKDSQAGQAAQNMNNVRNLLLACHMYTGDHGDQWPDELKQLVELGYMDSADAFRNPKRPDLELGYVYRKPEKDAGPRAVVFYEKYDGWPASGIAVGFWDGHVEQVASQERFQELLNAK